MQYRPEIDGLRAVAVLPVILFHAGFSIFSGGFVGVDVFFVISGYLITTILITERENGTYSLLHFYERRARRILPALFVMMAVCFVVAWFILPPILFEDYARSMAFSAVFLSNVHFWESTGYFATEAELQPLLHTWSLAIEEQYYILFPLILMALGVFSRARFLLVFGILAALSLALSEWGWRNHPDANFFFTFSRFWELLAGSICAVLLYKGKTGQNEWLAGLGLALIVFAVFAFDASVPFPSVYALVPVVGTALIILFAGPGTRTARLLSLGPMVAIGLISYSAYLWHQPLFAFARVLTSDHPFTGLMVVLAFASLGLAWLSWRYVELPFRNRKHPVLPDRRNLFAAAATGMAFFVAIGFWGMMSDGFKGRLDRGMTPYFASIMESFDEHHSYGDCFQEGEGLTRLVVLCPIFETESPQRTFGVVGDSHAAAMLPGFGAISERFNARILGAALPACPPILGVRINHDRLDAAFCKNVAEAHVQSLIDADIEAVFLVARWAYYSAGDYDGFHSHLALSPESGAHADDADAALTTLIQGLEQTIDRYVESGIRVILVHPVPDQKDYPRRYLETALLLSRDAQRTSSDLASSFVDLEAHLALQGATRAEMEALDSEHVLTVSVDNVFLENGRLKWLEGEKALYWDNNHLTPFGARRVGSYLAAAVAPFLETGS